MHRIYLRRFLFPVICAAAVALGCAREARAFNFSEHRALGDSAFSGFMDGLVRSGEFKSRDELCAFFESAASIKCAGDEAPYFIPLSNPPNYATFGVINGLSGDHEDNPLRLREELMHRYSVMNQIIALNARKNAMFSDQPSYSEIAAVNPRFPYLAIRNYSHFYNYGDALDKQLGMVDKNHLRLLESPMNGKKVFAELERSNSLDTYATLHLFAMEMADKAGRLAASDPERGKIYLSYAFLYEGFCGHFLEDSFASGHIIVRRSLLGGAVNNKPMHDFYCKLGLTVMNLNGDIWKTYGDNMLARVPDQWENAASYDAIAASTDTPHAAMARAAARVSLEELWSAYRAGLRGGNAPSVAERFPDDGDDAKEKFLLDNCRALHYVPVPYGSDLSRYNLPQDRIEQLNQANAPPQSRNFIRSRVANTVTGFFGTYDEGADYETRGVLGLRLNVMDSSRYHDMADKTGSVDYWSGYTASYLAALESELAPNVTRIAAGKSFFWDIWVSRKHYFSVYTYLEAGIAREESVNRLAFSPTIGIQPGSLLGLDNYTLPRWIWTPMQFILPLKISLGANYVPGRAPGYTVTGEVDLLF
ncbi:MAG: hypothetical protein WC421_05630 [Elusimicrobiales bacterium]